MKNLSIFFAMFFFSTMLFAQTEYGRGFKDGYKEGYCYNDYGCIGKLAPITPIPFIGEKSTSYQDGYNRGFKMGIGDKQRDEANKNSSNNSYTIDYQDVNQVSQNYYASTEASLLQDALARRNAAYNNNRKYIDNLYEWISVLKNKTNETEFINSINKCSNKLNSFEGEDLALFSKQIREVELEIQKQIDNYNSRINEANNPKTYWDAGNVAFNAGEYKSAIKNYTYVIHLSPDFAGSYLYRGVAYQRIGSLITAIEDYSSFINIEQNNPIGYIYRGWAKYYLNDLMGALSDFNKQIELAPTSESYYNRGSAKSGLNDNYGAIKDYQKAIELDNEFSMAYNNMAWSKFELKKYKEALIDANKAIELDNKNHVAFDSRAEIRFNLNDYNGCLADANMALQLNPNIANAYFLKGRVSYRQGEKENACAFWSKAGELGKKEAYEYISKYCNN